jgi:hypothetical protein
MDFEKYVRGRPARGQGDRARGSLLDKIVGNLSCFPIKSGSSKSARYSTILIDDEL